MTTADLDFACDTRSGSAAPVACPNGKTVVFQGDGNGMDTPQIVQRKVFTRRDVASLAEVEERLLRFQERYAQIAQPFQWRFTRQDLTAVLAKLDAGPTTIPLAA
jgi:hypothetical protein